MAATDSISPTPSGYRLLTDAQLEEIHDAALEILARTGTRVFDAQARDLLTEAGCTVHDIDLVKFPAHVIERALETAPSTIKLSNRSGEPAVTLGGHRTYFGTGSDLPHTRDLETGVRRPSVLADVARAARLADALPNLDFVMSMAQASDVDPSTSDWGSGAASLQIGDPADPFTLPRADGSTVSLADYHGKKHVLVTTYRAFW